MQEENKESSRVTKGDLRLDMMQMLQQQGSETQVEGAQGGDKVQSKKHLLGKTESCPVAESR